MFSGGGFVAGRVFLIGAKSSLGLGTAGALGVSSSPPSLTKSVKQSDILNGCTGCGTRFFANREPMLTDDEGESSSIARFTGLPGRPLLGVSALPFWMGVPNKTLAGLCFEGLGFLRGLGVFLVGVQVFESRFGAAALVGVAKTGFAGLCFTSPSVFSGLRVFLVGVILPCFAGVAFLSGLGVRFPVGVSDPFPLFGVPLLLAISLFFGVILLAGNSIAK